MVPTHVLDLDAPPRSRWDAIIPAFRAPLRRVVNELYATFTGAQAGGDARGDPFTQALALGLRKQLEELGFSEGFDDIVAVARLSGLPVEDIALLHLAYEAVDDSAARENRACGCTSLVSTESNGAPLLSRTLDWDIPSMRDLVVNFSVRQGGKEIAKVASFVGYVGALTAVRGASARGNGFAFAINYRASIGPAGESPAAEGAGGGAGGAAVPPAWPIGMLARHALQACASFAEAEALFRNAPLWAPCFVVLVGIAPSEHVVLSRSELATDSAWCCSAGGVVELAESGAVDGAAIGGAASGAPGGAGGARLVLVQANADHADVALSPRSALDADATFEAKRARWMSSVTGSSDADGADAGDADARVEVHSAADVREAIVAESAGRVRAARRLWALTSGDTAARLRCVLQNALISDESTIHGSELCVAPLRLESWVHRPDPARSALRRGEGGGVTTRESGAAPRAASKSRAGQQLERRCACS
jgi:hypothetical protein